MLNQLINGLAQGGIYSLTAIGFAIIYGMIGLVTFAHGEVYMIGAFAGFFLLTRWDVGFALALLGGLVAAGFLGFCIERIAFKPLRQAPPTTSLICTIGISIILKNLAQIVFGAQTQAMPTVFPEVYFDLWGARISLMQLVLIGMSILLIAVLQWFIYKTRLGLAIRAVSMDQKAAALMGMDVDRIIWVGFSIGSALSGAAGLMVGLYYNAVYPLMGSIAGLKAFSSGVLGGLTSIPGAALGGMILGLAESFGVHYISSGYRDVIAFVILILILLIRPQGLMGRKADTRRL